MESDKEDKKENANNDPIRMMDLLMRAIFCAAVFTVTGVSNAQVNVTGSRSDTERFSLLQPEQRLLQTTYLGTATLPRIPSSYDYNALGLFCKLDVQFEKRLKFPVFLRMGDAQSIAAWEGKGVLRKR